jgi:hypothetical protein
MSRYVRVCVVGVLLSLWSVGSLQAASRFFDAKTMMPSSQITRGMKAVARTVFQGTTISEFHLEILGVQEQGNLGKDMILARVIDGPCVERQSGIIGGMSGSPVYIDGKLIGAIAYGWGFTKEPIAGITTIDSMLEGFEGAPAATKAAAAPDSRSIACEPVSLAGRQITSVRLTSAVGASPFADSHTINMYPVAPLVYCSGMTATGRGILKKLLSPHGIEPLDGPGAKKDPVPAELVPGAAVAVRLMSGDFEAAGIGTVTYRDGDRILAFGHPMMEMGKVAMPLGTAWIYDFVPSYQRSNKLGAAMTTVGTLESDNPWSIGGEIGKTAPTVPVDIHITDETRGITRAFHVDVTSERTLAGDLAMSAAASALESTFNTADEGTALVKFRVEGENGDRIVRENRFFHSGQAAQTAVSEVGDAVELLTDNRFTPQKIKRMTFDASLNTKHDVALIEKVYAEENVARAGEKLTLHVVIRPEGKGPVEKIVKLDLPIDLPKGNMRVGVSAGSESMLLRARLGCLLPDFECLKDVIKLVEAQEHNTQLFVATGLPTTGLSVGGTHLMQLPAAIETILEQSPRTDLTRGKSELSKVVDTDWVLVGHEVFSIATANREGAKGAPASPPKATKEGDKEEASANTAGDDDLTPAVSTGVPRGLWWAASAFMPRAGATPAVGGASPSARAARFGADTADSDLSDDADSNATDTPGARVARSHTPATAAASGKRTDASADDSDDAKADDKTKDDKGPVSRQPQTWTQDSKDDFATGEATGVAVISDGTLALTPQWEHVAHAEQLYVWSVAASPAGDIYVGTGGPGKVYKYVDGKLALLYDTGEFGVHSLVVDADGSIVAGTAPDGKVFRITPAGEGKLLCKTPASYVWALCPDGKGGLYAGTGPKGRIYSISAAGACKPLAATNQTHVTSLTMCGGVLYAGTSEKGVVYRVTADRRLEAVFDAGEGNITSLATDGKDKVYAAVAPKGAIYEIRSDGSSEKVYDDDKQAIMSLAWEKGVLYGGTGDDGRIVTFLGNDRTATLHDDKEAAFITCLCPDGKGSIFAGTVNPGVLLCAHNDKPADGVLKSSVLDAKRVSKWGIADWRANVPDGTSVKVSTRSGNSNDPDDGSWTVWSRDYSRPGEDRVDSAPGRFLQYRLQLHKSAGPAIPTVDRVMVSYLPENQKPTVSLTAPDQMQAVRKELELKWKASDPDGDSLLATVYMQKPGDTSWQPLKANLTTDSYKWDTSKLPDGVYRIKVSVTDAPSNAVGALTDETPERLVVVDNTPPDLRIDDAPTQLEADKPLTISGRAMDSLTRIAGVQWRFDGQDTWYSAQPVDGLFDSRYETFTFTTPPIGKDVKAIVVRARNAAGGATDQTIPAPKKDDTRPRLKPAS